MEVWLLWKYLCIVIYKCIVILVSDIKIVCVKVNGYFVIGKWDI